MSLVSPSAKPVFMHHLFLMFDTLAWLLIGVFLVYFPVDNADMDKIGGRRIPLDILHFEEVEIVTVAEIHILNFGVLRQGEGVYLHFPDGAVILEFRAAQERRHLVPGLEADELFVGLAVLHGGMCADDVVALL